MTEKQQLITWSNSYGAAMKSGDPNLINLASTGLQQLLNSLPDNWTKKEDPAPNSTEEQNALDPS